MWRVFYYPFLFRLKRWPQKRAILFTVLVMFGITWLLHGWQWYWVKGSFPLLANDILYWTLFGLILAYVSVRAFSVSIKKKKENHFINGMRIVYMFFAMSFLWSFWTAGSLTEWIYIFSKFLKLDFISVLLLTLSISGIFILGGIIAVVQEKTKWFSVFTETLSGNTRNVIFILLAGAGLFYHYENKSIAIPLSKMFDPQLNLHDRNIVERGYYEQLLTTNQMNQQLRPVFKKSEENDFQNTAYQNEKGLLPRILKNDFHTSFKGKKFSTNAFGMRDRNYNQTKASGIYRICLLGGSYEMGSGVADGEPYEQIVEDSLNKINIRNEIFNMGIGGYHALQMIRSAQKAIQFNPDAVIYVCHSSERQRMINNLLSLISAGKDVEFPFVKKIIAQSEIKPGKMCQLEMYERLMPYSDTLLKFCYHEIAQECLKNNIKPVWVYLPAIGDLRQDDDREFCIGIARSENFEIINLDGIFDGKEIRNITVSDEDTHPNAYGHRIIANGLYDNIRNIIVGKQSFLYLPKSKFTIIKSDQLKTE